MSILVFWVPAAHICVTAVIHRFGFCCGWQPGRRRTVQFIEKVEVVVMTVSWTEPARELVELLGVGLDALASLLVSAQAGALTLSLIEPLDEDFWLSDAAIALGDALDQLALVAPETSQCPVTVTLGALRWDDLIAYRQGIEGLLGAAADVVAQMLREQAADLDTTQLLALAHVVHLVGRAYRLVGGRVL